MTLGRPVTEMCLCVELALAIAEALTCPMSHTTADFLYWGKALRLG